MGGKRAKNTSLSIPNRPQSLLEKHVFEAFLAHFGPKAAIFKAFWDFPWPKMCQPRSQIELKTLG